MLALATAWIMPAFAAAIKQQRFPSAEEGVQALIAAMKAGDLRAMLDVLGHEARPLIVSGDAVADLKDRERMVQEYEESNSLMKSDDTKAVLQVGKDD